jgi:catechol 2,3-dioxygenase-like lactoylglutathione lyase family enzyme
MNDCTRNTVNGVRPAATAGLRHVALFTARFEEAVSFYTDLLGMHIEWHPDVDNIYLSSGVDNLAIHRFKGEAREPAQQRLDHIGFILHTPEDVDAWHAFLSANGVCILAAPRTHRDGARSFYCLDPDGTTVQMIYHPPISGFRFSQ